MTTEAITRAFIEAFRTELLLGSPQAPVDLPPPTDIPAEESIVSALLNRHETLESIAPLRASDFFRPIHQLLVVAIDVIAGAGLPLEPARVVAAIEAQGYDGARLLDEVLRLRSDIPAVVPIDGPVARVLEASRARALLAAITSTGAGLRAQALTVSEALGRLRTACEVCS